LSHLLVPVSLFLLNVLFKWFTTAGSRRDGVWAVNERRETTVDGIVKKKKQKKKQPILL